MTDFLFMSFYVIVSVQYDPPTGYKQRWQIYEKIIDIQCKV